MFYRKFQSFYLSFGQIIGTFKFEYPENCEYPENIWDIKFEFLNILKDIEVSWTLSQCHKVVYTENPEYPEKYSVQYSVLSPNINILVNIQKTSSSGTKDTIGCLLDSSSFIRI